MGGIEKDHILKFWEENGIGRSIEEIRKRQHQTVESFVVEMLRHPAFTHCCPDDIELQIKTAIGTPNNPYEIVVTYSIKHKGKSR